MWRIKYILHILFQMQNSIKKLLYSEGVDSAD